MMRIEGEGIFNDEEMEFLKENTQVRVKKIGKFYFSSEYDTGGAPTLYVWVYDSNKNPIDKISWDEPNLPSEKEILKQILKYVSPADVVADSVANGLWRKARSQFKRYALSASDLKGFLNDGEISRLLK